MKRFIRSLLVLGLIALAGRSVAAAPAITGLWLTERRKVSVELFECGEELCGRIAWIADPKDAVKLDARNPDPSLRDRPWCGMTVITGLQRAAPGAWRGGSFYYPQRGRYYSLKIDQKVDGLEVRAYAGPEFLGKTEHWTRADPSLRGCPEG